MNKFQSSKRVCNVKKNLKNLYKAIFVLFRIKDISFLRGVFAGIVAVYCVTTLRNYLIGSSSACKVFIMSASKCYLSFIISILEGGLLSKKPRVIRERETTNVIVKKCNNDSGG